MKTFIITCCVLSLVALAWLSVPHWPRSTVQDYVLLYLNDRKLQKLISEADNTPYNIIRWMSDQGTQAGVRSDTGIDWADDPVLSQELLAAFQQLDTNYFLLVKQNGFWSFPGYTKTELLNAGKDSLTRRRKIDYFYRYGGGLIYQECNDQIIATTPTGRCDRLLFGSWVLEKTWFIMGEFSD